MTRLCLILICLTLAVPAVAQETDAEKADRMAWFQDAKLGIFIHWGIYAVDGIDESWSFHNGHVTHDDYMAQLDGFTAANYDPQQWAQLITDSGAQYAVLTAKHHDGVALWDSKATDLTVVNRTPAGRDLIGPYAEALRAAGLKVGLYYSLIDWTDPNYPNFLRDQKRYEDDPERWAAFSQANQAQISELSKLYRPDLVWFDGDWEFSAEQWGAQEIRANLLADNPGVIINSRLQGYGDYATPEQGVPITPPADPYWELCLTTNESWGYQGRDQTYKTVNQVIQLFVECLSLGGNLLLDIGPKEDGTICVEQVAILEGLGRWVRKHEEAVYGVGAGLPPGHFHGPSAVAADSSTVYLFLPGKPNGPVMLKGLRNEVKAIRVVGNDAPLDWDIKMKRSWSDVPGVVFVEVPADGLDEEMTILAVDLVGKVSLYRGKN